MTYRNSTYPTKINSLHNANTSLQYTTGKAEQAYEHNFKETMITERLSMENM